MQVIMMKGQTNPSHAEAQDSLAAVKSIPGFIVGYIDNKEHRVISFHVDTHPNSALAQGQQRVELALAG